MALALVAVIAAATIMGFTKAENERIWLFLVPLACVAAAAQHRRSTTTVLAALALQALVVQVLITLAGRRSRDRPKPRPGDPRRPAIRSRSAKRSA